MLEGLVAIDWDRLTHAYGEAGDVPDLLRGLTSPDPEVWVGAMSGLYDTICHQTCTVYEATATAVPFLLELLGERQVRCRGRILQFLGDAARATSYLAAHGGLSHYDARRETAEFQDQLAEELGWVRATREAIWSGLDLYLDLLTDLDRRIRIIVPYTLGLLCGRAVEEMPEAVRQREPFRLLAERMARHLDEEPSELVRASLVFGLASLLPHRPEVRELLEGQVVEPLPSLQVRLSAALGLAGAGSLTPAVFDILVTALDSPDETNALFDSDQPAMESRHHPISKFYARLDGPMDPTEEPDDHGKDEDFRFPWIDGWVTDRILNRLAGVPEETLPRLVPVLTPYLDRATPYTCENVAGPILRLVFGDRKVTSNTRRDDLTPAQVDVLRHLYDNLSLWATNIGNVGLAFMKFGLPYRRAEWARLLDIEERPLSDAEIVAILDRLAPQQQYRRERDAIKRLNLRQIGTPAFLPHLSAYPDLVDLDLSGVSITDADLVHIRPLTKLERLHLAGAKLTDASVPMLLTMRELRDLNLSGSHLTDAGLAALVGLENLHSLYLGRANVSDEAVRRFQQARPKCRLTR